MSESTTLPIPPPPPSEDASTIPINPPPYEETDISSDSDIEEEDLLYSSHTRHHNPLSLTINTASSTHGTANLVQTPPPPYEEITKLSTSLLETLHKMTSSSRGSRRQMKIELTINCGITVMGTRNVVGGIGLRPKGSVVSAPESGVAVVDDAPAADIGVDHASGGAKRKAEDSPESTSEPLMKRLATES